jgi:UDP-N-acetylglucosamine 2-epimerase
MKKIISVVGARPQFIKAKLLVDGLKEKGIDHALVHTGQHYDYEMSKIFFDELTIPRPRYNLNVGSHTPGKQLSLIIERLEKVLLKEKPEIVIAYGDTNSTLAAALTAVKLQITLCHVEAGLRSYNRTMPEEINRVVTDHLSDILFCPSQTAVNNLAKEGISDGVHLVGDIMYDLLLQFKDIASKDSKILSRLKLVPKNYLLATLHRPANADSATNIKRILRAFKEINQHIVLPLHPRTLRTLKKNAIKLPPCVQLIKPVGYLDILTLEKNARIIITDSGGVQKESYWLGVPCVTLREETEWLETVKNGWNVLVGSDPDRLVEEIRRIKLPKKRPQLYGDGHTTPRIVNYLKNKLRKYPSD